MVCHNKALAADPFHVKAGKVSDFSGPGRKRPSDPVRQQFIGYIKDGKTVKEACKLIDRQITTYKEWRISVPGFAEAVDAARVLRSGDTPPDWFQRDFAGFRKAYFNFDTYPHQIGLVNALESTKPQHITMCLFAPEMGKTTTLEDFVCYTLAKDPDHRFGIVSESQGHARKMIARIQRRMTPPIPTPYTLRFGPFKSEEDEGKPWRADYFTVGKSQHDERDASVAAVGWTSQIYGARIDTLIVDDIQSRRSINRTDDMVRTFRQDFLSRIGKMGRVIIIGCLTADSRVTMSDGTFKPIVDVRAGESVWLIDPDTGSLRTAPVKAMIPQGEAEVVEIVAGNQVVRATGTHPFLTIRNHALTWVRADELLPGDHLASLKALPDLQAPLPGGIDYVTEQFLWLLGFLWGDGWITASADNYKTCIALGVDEALNQKVQAAFEEVFDTPLLRSPARYFICQTKRVYDTLSDLGLRGKAKTKRLPAWLFGRSAREKQLFLRGFADADGTPTARSLDSFRIELANPALVQDVYDLAMTCGVRPTRIYRRTRIIQPPNSPEPVEMESASIALNFATIDRAREYQSRTSFKSNVASPHLRFPTVSSVQPVGKEHVYDLSIADPAACFIANGFAVHNTRVGIGDFYERLLEEDLPHTVIKFPAVDSGGKALCPQLWNEEQLVEKRRQVGEEVWWTAYMQSPQINQLSTFTEEMIQLCLDHDRSIGRLADASLNAISLDPALGGGNALTAWTYKIDKMILLDCEKVFNLARTEDILGRVADFAIRYQPRKLIVEKDAFQKGLAADERLRDLGKQYGFEIVPHVTARQKADEIMGVASMAGSFQRGEIRIPYGDEIARARMQPLLTELRNWRPNLSSRLLEQDLVMSSWFSWRAWLAVRDQFSAKPVKEWRPSWIRGRQERRFAAV